MSKIDFMDYRQPKVSAEIEFEDVQDTQVVTEFHTLMIGKGLTVRNKKVQRLDLRANTHKFPEVTLTWDIAGDFNFQNYSALDFNLTKLSVHKVTPNGVERVEIPIENVTVKYAAVAQTLEGKMTTVVEIDAPNVTAADSMYDAEFEVTMDDQDIKIHTVSNRDKMFLGDIFGDLELNENGEEYFNDIAFAAEIAFKTGVKKFMYVEVPRNYGEEPTVQDFKSVIDKIYYERNVYRIVPLSDNLEVTKAVHSFVKAISNPVDERETVAFMNYETAKIEDHNNLEEILEKVGTLSEGIDSERICNIFGITAVELAVDHRRYVLPSYFMNAAVALLDDNLGMSKPLSTREIEVFVAVHGPKFRPKHWDILAQKGVFIVYQEKVKGPIIIRHQLTTKQSDRAELQEYSTTKNLDATVQLIRDRLKPYAGKENIVDGYFEKVDATFTTAKEDAIASELVRDIIPLTKWQLRKIGSGENQKEIKRNVVGMFRLVPLYPGNNIDVHFIV